MFSARWSDMLGGEIEENTSLINGLKDKYRLFGLTNWSAETFPHVFQQYSFFLELEGIVISGEEKLVKPDVRIYELLLSRYGLIASESLFIDDNKQNVLAADKLGFQTIHLNKGWVLKDELEKISGS